MLLNWALLLVVGMTAGAMGAVLGLGGGIFLVPALTFIFGLPIQVAVGATLIGVIATSAGVAVACTAGAAQFPPGCSSGTGERIRCVGRQFPGRENEPGDAVAGVRGDRAGYYFLHLYEGAPC